MTDTTAARIEELGLSVAVPAPPVANYLPFTHSVVNPDAQAPGTQWTLHVSGQLPKGPDGNLITGTVGKDVTPEKAAEAARQCALNVIGQARHATGNLDRVVRVLKVNVFVAATPDFTAHPVVANGVSDLLVAVFGEERGRHARAAVGVASLPLGCAVEVDATLLITTA